MKHEKYVDQLVGEAEKYDLEYLHGTVHAVELYDHERDLRRVIREFLGRKNLGAFKLTNPFSKQAWIREVLLAFLHHQIHRTDDQRVLFGDADMRLDGEARYYKSAFFPCFFVTFTHREWACADTNVDFNIKAAKQKVRNALTGLSYIATFEAAYYVNEQWVTGGKEGNLISFHCHAVIWASTSQQLKSDLNTRLSLAGRRKKILSRFQPILGNRSGVRFDTLRTLDDACRALRYQAKMATRGYSTRSCDGKTVQREATLSSAQRYRLFCAFKDYDLLDFWLAGGEGSSILKTARHKLLVHRLNARSRERAGYFDRPKPSFGRKKWPDFQHSSSS